MGRFTSAGGAGVPRKHTIRRLGSDPAVPIPSWARVAYVTGIGPGGGGGNCNSGTSRGGGGASGGYANRCPLQINGEATLSIEIGAPGAPGAPSSNAAGGNGGNTRVTLGGITLVLQGGRGGAGNTNASGGHGGRAWIEQAGNVNGEFNVGTGGGSDGFFAPASPIALGQPGGNATLGGVLGGGAPSPFGAGGNNVNAGAINMPGVSAVGFGSGGAGANGAGTAGMGAPSFILIEFEEAITA